jgi:hypothetical protein
MTYSFRESFFEMKAVFAQLGEQLAHLHPNAPNVKGEYRILIASKCERAEQLRCKMQHA